MSDSGHPTAHRSRPWRRSPFTLVSWRWGISGRTWEGQKGSQGGPGAPVEAVGCVLCICLPQLVAPVTGLKCASDQHAEFHMAPCPQSHAICGWHGVPLSRPSAPPLSDSCFPFFHPELLFHFLVGLANGTCCSQSSGPRHGSTPTWLHGPLLSVVPAWWALDPASLSKEPPRHSETMPSLLCPSDPRTPSLPNLHPDSANGGCSTDQNGWGGTWEERVGAQRPVPPHLLLQSHPQPLGRQKLMSEPMDLVLAQPLGAMTAMCYMCPILQLG